MEKDNINLLRSRLDYQQVERRMQSEYVAEFYSHLKTFINLRLGQPKSALYEDIPPDIDPRIFLVKNPRADAVIIAPTTIYLLEFCLEMSWNKIAQLLYYRRFIRETAELKEYSDRLIKSRLIYAIFEPAAAKYAKEENIEIEQYVRPWMLPLIDKIKRHYVEGRKD